MYSREYLLTLKKIDIVYNMLMSTNEELDLMRNGRMRENLGWLLAIRKPLEEELAILRVEHSRLWREDK